MKKCFFKSISFENLKKNHHHIHKHILIPYATIYIPFLFKLNLNSINFFWIELMKWIRIPLQHDLWIWYSISTWTHLNAQKQHKMMSMNKEYGDLSIESHNCWKNWQPCLITLITSRLVTSPKQKWELTIHHTYNISTLEALLGFTVLAF